MSMPREPKNYDHLIGKIKGLSENQLKAHFTLYQEYSELKRREPVAYNGTFLHEYYFDNIGGDGSPAPENLKQIISGAFGSYDNWIADVKAAAASAHGWGLTCYGYARQ